MRLLPEKELSIAFLSIFQGQCGLHHHKRKWHCKLLRCRWECCVDPWASDEFRERVVGLQSYFLACALAMYQISWVTHYRVPWSARIFCETKTKFLCRTKQNGALGAILAQAPRALKMNLFLLCLFSLLLAVRNVSSPECCYALERFVRHQDLLPATRRSLDSLHGNGRRPWRRSQIVSCSSTGSSCSFSEQGQTSRWRVSDSSACVPCWVGIQVGEENSTCKRRWRLGSMGRPLSVARNFHHSSDYSTYHCDHSNSSGKKNEDDTNLGPRRRWRFHRGTRGHEGEMVSTVSVDNWRMATRGRRTVVGTSFRFAQEDECTRHCTFRGLCHLRTLWTTGFKSFKIQNLCGFPEWLRDEGTTRSSFISPVACLFQSVSHCNADAGCNDNVHAAQLRGNDREAEQAISLSLAPSLLSGRTGKVSPFEQDKIEDCVGHQEWHPSSEELGPYKTLGLHLPELSRGRSVLADSGTRTCTCMGGIRFERHAKNSSRTDCILLDAGRCGGNCSSGRHCRQVPKKEVEEGEEGNEEEEVRRQRRGTPKENHERRRSQGSKREAEMFCLEPWKWALWGIATWASLRGKGEEGAQMHDMQLARSPFEVLSPEETKLGRQQPSGARSRSRRRRREDDKRKERDRSRRRRKRSSSDKSERRGDRSSEDDRDVHEARGGPKATSEEEYFASRAFRFIHYFAGPNDPLADALQEAAAREGLRVDIHSVEKKTGSGDLLADEPYRSDLDQASKGMIDGFHAGFPCNTYSRLRFRKADGMPGPVRTKSEPYGKKGNSRREQKEADDGTVMAARSITYAKTVATSRPNKKVVPIATLENPPPTDHPEHLSACELPEMDAFKLLECCSTLVFHTCQFQLDKPVRERHYKPQMFVGSLYNLRSLTRFCDCDGGPKQHDPVVGKSKSEAAGEYTKAFCDCYADLVMQHFRKMGREEFLLHRMKQLGKQIEVSMEEIDKKKVVLVPNKSTERSTSSAKSRRDEDRDTGVPSRADRKEATKDHEFQGGEGKYGMLKKSTAKASDPKLLDFVGGMKDPCKVVQPMSNLLSLGLRIRASWEAFCKEYPNALNVAESYGTPDCAFDEEAVKKWKEKLKKAVGAKGAPSLKMKGKFEYSSPLDPELIDAWVNRGNDPERCVSKWVREGAPLGISKPIPTCGIFPEAHAEDINHQGEHELLDAEAQLARGDLHNYTSVTADVENAKVELHRYEREGYVRTIPKDMVQKEMGGGTISRLGLIVKEKAEGIKRRIIIDLRRSGGNLKASLPEKLVLPRPRDAVESIRNVFSLRRDDREGPGYARELVVIDISDAFMTLGVHGDELQHTLAPHVEDPDQFYLFCALLFGYKTAPLLWSRVAALLARLLQSLVSADEAQHQVYLDDALWVLQGTLASRNSLLAMLLTTMASIGFKVSLKKGERATQVLWIGVQFSLHEDILLVTVPKKFIDTLLETISNWKGMASIKELRTTCGRLSRLSGLLPRLRWVVAVFYRVLHQRLQDLKSGTEETRRHSRPDDRPKEHLFYVKQLEQPLKWLQAFLSASIEHPVKKYKLDINKYPKATIVTDASPEGLGGILLVNNRLVRSFSSPVMEEDALALGFKYMESSSQGVVETLAVLVAIRHWARELSSCRVDLQVQSDSVTALALSQKLSNKDSALNFLGGELAIQCERIGIEALSASHLPGSANTVADFLSRPSKWKDISMPEDLRGIEVQTPEARIEGWYALPTPKAAPELWLSGQSAASAWASIRLQWPKR